MAFQLPQIQIRQRKRFDFWKLLYLLKIFYISIVIQPRPKCVLNSNQTVHHSQTLLSRPRSTRVLTKSSNPPWHHYELFGCLARVYTACNTCRRFSPLLKHCPGWCTHPRNLDQARPPKNNGQLVPSRMDSVYKTCFKSRLILCFKTFTSN